MFQHHPQLIFEWDLLLPGIVRAANTRCIKTFGFSPAQLLLGFNPRYSKGVDEFEDILRLRAVDESIDSLMSEETMTLEEANFKSRLAILDKLRERSLSKRFRSGESLAKATAKSGIPAREIRKGLLARLRRLDQDNQHSHKLEPRWEGPYGVHKMAAHGHSAWIEDLYSARVKRRYHINSLSLFVEGKEVGRSEEKWRTVTDLNAQIQRGSAAIHVEQGAE